MNNKELLATSRYLNLMAITQSRFDNKIQSLCLFLNMPHLANFLSHKKKPSRSIGDKVARRIENLLELAPFELDEPHPIYQNFSPSSVGDDEYYRYRKENLTRIVDLLFGANASQFTRETGINIAPYLNKTEPRKIGHKLSAKIEKTLSLAPDSLSSPLPFFTLIKDLPHKSILDLKLTLEERLEQVIATSHVVLNAQNSAIDHFLAACVEAISETTHLELIPKDVLHPAWGYSQGLPVFYDHQCQKYLILGIEGIACQHSWKTLKAQKALSNHGSNDDFNVQLIKHHPSNTEMLCQALTLHDKAVQRALESHSNYMRKSLLNTVDSYLETRFHCRSLFSYLSEINLKLVTQPFDESFTPTTIQGFTFFKNTSCSTGQAGIIIPSPELTSKIPELSIIFDEWVAQDPQKNVNVFIQDKHTEPGQFSIIPVKSWCKWADHYQRHSMA